MGAIMIIPTSMSAFVKWSLVTNTIDFIYPYMTISLTKQASGSSKMNCTIPELTTNNFCIPDIPRIITDSSPVAIMKYLHSSFSGSEAINQSNSFSWNEMICAKLISIYFNWNWKGRTQSVYLELLLVCICRPLQRLPNESNCGFPIHYDDTPRCFVHHQHNELHQAKSGMVVKFQNHTIHNSVCSRLPQSIPACGK